MKDFTRITEFSYDIKLILFAIFGLIAIIISIILFMSYYKKIRHANNADDISGKPLYIGCVIFIAGLPFFLTTMFSLSSLNKQFAEYEGQFEVIKSNTNIVYSDRYVQKEITLKDKDNHVQVFSVDNNAKYNKGDIVKIKIKAQKGIKPSLQYKISPQKDTSNHKQTLISIKKIK